MEESLEKKSNIPDKISWIAISSGLIAYTIASYLSRTSAPFFVAMSVVVITLLIGLTWRFRNLIRYWFIMAIISGVHVLFLWEFNFPKKISYGFIFSPFIIIETLLLYKILLFFLEKRESQ